MGGAFALMFLWFMALAIGIIFLLLGTILLIIRAIARKKNKANKHIVMLVTGILMLIPGIGLVGFDVLSLMGLGGISIAMKKASDDRSDYFYGTDKTDRIVAMDMERLSFNGGLNYPYETIEIDGVTYTPSGMENLEYKDPDRGDAILTIEDTGDSEKRFVVYEYANDSGCDLISIGMNVYCPEEQIEQLMDHYSGCGFRYEVRDSHGGDYKSASFPDDAYLALIKGEPEITVKAENEFVTDKSAQIRQISDDGKFVREFTVVFTVDGEVRVHVLKDPLRKYEEDGRLPKYKVTDKTMIKLLEEYTTGE